MDKLSVELLHTATHALTKQLAKVARKARPRAAAASAPSGNAAATKIGNQAEVIIIHQQTQHL